jgi:DNA-binding GntR family transcriptional regulator
MRQNDGTTIGHRHQPLRDQVLDEIRRRIVDGDYPPGTRLTEERLAADFGVSRNPVREALRVVETEGFVTLTPRRGAVVTTPDAGAIGDLFAIRGSLEATAARLAAERATPDDIAALRALLEAARVATDEQDLTRVARLNNDLHRLCIAITGNHWLMTMSGALYLHVQWVFRIGAAERAPHSWAEHIRIVDAIEAHDPDAAEAAVRAHLTAAAASAIAHVA